MRWNCCRKLLQNNGAKTEDLETEEARKEEDAASSLVAAVFNRHAPLQFFHHHSTTDFADVLIVFRDLGQLDLSSSNQLISVICGP
jgi:hypothetical protein